MNKFLKNIIRFILFSIIIGEIVVRTTHAVSDIPQRTIDEFGIQKYLPNQQGYWKDGKHQWEINKLGWPGQLPEFYDKLIIVIGDSFIENFMNPTECHQSELLKAKMEDYNFMEAARSGVSLIEAMEISKHIDSLQPIQTLIYVNNGDFLESVSQVSKMNDITQLDIETNTIKYGEMKAAFMKKILYNWKLLYYFYNRLPLGNFDENEEKQIKQPKASDNNFLGFQNEMSNLINYIKDNYSIKNKTLVFHPNSNMSLIELCKNAGFNIILLDSSNDISWTFDYDSHWTCYGHERAAQQVSQQLLSDFLNDIVR